jgi:hypothetical protein
LAGTGVTAVEYQQIDSLQLLLDYRRYYKYENEIFYHCIGMNKPEAITTVLKKDWENSQPGKSRLLAASSKWLKKIKAAVSMRWTQLARQFGRQFKLCSVNLNWLFIT